jgi:CRISPR-associated protein Cmr1
MKTITFTCETITPMFLSGADGQTPELRPPSIKGALRFWWRAMNGHLSLKELKERESLIFGGTEGSGRSKLLVRSNIILSKNSVELLVPHKPFMKQEAFSANHTTFSVTLSLTQALDYFDETHMQSLFIITATLGGFGKRSRRGMGSVSITDSTPQKIMQPSSLEDILFHLKRFSPYFVNDGKKIYHNFSGALQQYASIRQIQVGDFDSNSENALLRKISDKTHEFHQKDTWKYGASMGTAKGGRFSSPIYVSVIKGSVKPIITTLNTAPNKNKDKVSTLLQEDFKNSILS